MYTFLELGTNSMFFVTPAVHSCRENPRQLEDENVDGNTRLVLDVLV